VLCAMCYVLWTMYVLCAAWVLPDDILSCIPKDGRGGLDPTNLLISGAVHESGCLGQNVTEGIRINSRADGSI